MALKIDELPNEITRLHAALDGMLEGHRRLRSEFAVAVLAGDNMALQAIRPRLAKADADVDAIYELYRAEIARFGSLVCRAVRDLQAEAADPQKSGD